MTWRDQIDNDHIQQPSAIAGKANGSEAIEAITHPIFDHLGHTVGHLAPVAARSWNAMVRAAWQDGISLVPSGPYDSFRPLHEQQRIFGQRYTTRDTGVPGRRCGGVYYHKVNTHVATAACPGTSNHGKAGAVDFQRQTRAVLAWMEAHAKAFGWQWELASEEWHVHYMLGDQVSQAVLDAEKTHPTPAPQPQEDDDVYDLVMAIQSRDGELAPELQGNLWWFVSAAERAWCPTAGNAQAAFDAGLCKRATPREVSPSWISEKRPMSLLDADPRTYGQGPNGNYPPPVEYSVEERNHLNLVQNDVEIIKAAVVQGP